MCCSVSLWQCTAYVSHARLVTCLLCVAVVPLQRVTSLSPSSAGRLPAHALKELFELQRKAEGGPVDASHLISKCVEHMAELGGKTGC